MNDSALNITDRAPASAATSHRLTGVPAKNAVPLLKPSTTANRHTAVAITQPAAVSTGGSSGSWNSSTSSSGLARGLPASSRAMSSISGVLSRALSRSSSAREFSSAACAINWSICCSSFCSSPGGGFIAHSIEVDSRPNDPGSRQHLPSLDRRTSSRRQFGSRRRRVQSIARCGRGARGVGFRSRSRRGGARGAGSLSGLGRHSGAAARARVVQVQGNRRVASRRAGGASSPPSTASWSATRPVK